MDTKAITDETAALWGIAVDYGPRFVGAIIVLLVGILIARTSSAFVSRGLNRARIDNTLRPIVANIVHYTILAVTLLIVVQQFGVQTASLLALFGSVGLAVGLAMQGTLSNVAAGLMLLFLRPYEVGDVVEAGGQIGTVLALGLFHTNLRTTDGVDIIVPNSNVLSAPVRNMSRFPERVLTMSITVAAHADLDRAVTALRDTLIAQPLIAKDRESTVGVKSITGGGSEIIVNVWVRNEDYHEARTQYLASIRSVLAKAGIDLA